MLWQLVVLATTNVPRREIAPRVYMPLINFGFQKNHTSAFELGVRGVLLRPKPLVLRDTRHQPRARPRVCELALKCAHALLSSVAERALMLESALQRCMLLGPPRP